MWEWIQAHLVVTVLIGFILVCAIILLIVLLVSKIKKRKAKKGYVVGEAYAQQDFEKLFSESCDKSEQREESDEIQSDNL